MQPTTPEIVGTSEVIDTSDTCNKVESIQPIVAIIANINNVCVRSPDKYGCNDGFAISMVEKVMSENFCGVVKGARRVDVLIRSTVMAKFKQGPNLKEVHGG